MFNIGMPELIVILVLVFLVLPGWMIAKKAGFNPWLSLLFLIPYLNVILLWVFAFIKWPVQKELEMARARLS